MAMLDSGCDTTIVPLSIVQKETIHSTEQQCLAANGTEIAIKGWVSLPAVIGDKYVEINGLVTEHVGDILLGIDFFAGL